MEKAQNLRVTLGIAPTPASGETAAVAAQSVPPKDVSNVTKSSPPPSSHDVKSTALRSGTNGSESNFPEQAARTNDAAVAAAVADGEGGDGNHAQPARLRRGGLRGKGEGREEEGGGRRNARRVVLEKASAAGKAEVPEELEGGTATTEERVKRVELGAELWDATYVPSIEPGRRQELIKKWSPPGGQQVCVCVAVVVVVAVAVFKKIYMYARHSVSCLNCCCGELFSGGWGEENVSILRFGLFTGRFCVDFFFFNVCSRGSFL